MFTQPVPSQAVPRPSSNTVSPSRSSRLRGLSYLRNYTQNHLLAREASNSSTPTNTTGANTPRQGAGLTRSVSYTPGALSANTASSSVNSNRLSLVSSTPESRSNREAAVAAAAAPDAISESSDFKQQGPATMASDNEDGPAAPKTTGADGAAAAASGSHADAPPAIRFTSYYDPRATRPSLTFSAITRTLPNGHEVIRVGRYSERDNQPVTTNPNQPSAAPVGFKSKVVSRRHCEFWYEDGKWYIKDVKSSSGTFLNHIRLSPPSQESKAFAVNDGDIVQLGIDFKGGEEMIFRCVKMRLELNRGWQNKPNSFNVAAHKRLRTLAATANGGPSGKTPAGASNSSQDCSICLNSVAPCQSLFVAPCSHTWHFKCVKSLLMSPQYPVFICPNCRAGADLEADVDEPTEEWEMFDEDEKEAKSEEEEKDDKSEEGSQADAAHSAGPDAEVPDADRMDITITDAVDLSADSNSPAHATSSPLPIRHAHGVRRTTPSPPRPGAEGPITPRNDVGPWVLDGRAGRASPDAPPEMGSIDAAATEMDLTVHIADETLH